MAIQVGNDIHAWQAWRTELGRRGAAARWASEKAHPERATRRLAIALAAILAKISKDAKTECWLWNGSIKSNGYGALSYAGQKWHAHRFFYVQLIGPIPAGLHIDHLCRNRACVNPAHLEPVTQAVNNRRTPKALRLNKKQRTFAELPVDGRRIYTIRMALGLTLDEFGQRLGVCGSTICAWENGRNRVSHDRIVAAENLLMAHGRGD